MVQRFVQFAVALSCLAIPSAASAAVTIGSVSGTPSSGCRSGEFDCTYTMLDGSLVAPADGVIVRYSVHHGPQGSNIPAFGLRILQGSGSPFTSRVATGTDLPRNRGDAVETFTFTDSAGRPNGSPIAAGERIGLYSSAPELAVLTAGTSAGEAAGNVGNGSGTFTTRPGFNLLLQAVIEPDANHNGFGDETQEPGGGGGGLPTPVAGRTGNASVVSGTVLVRVPGSNRFVSLTQATAVPVGSQLDTTRGTLKLTVALRRSGGTAAARLSGGRFRFTQPLRSGSGVLPTDLALKGGDFSGCPRSGRASGARRRAIRYLEAKATGRFNVIGKNSSGVERGTTWTTTDTCAGTLTAVTAGSVAVRDFARHKTIIVRAGKSYLATG